MAGAGGFEPPSDGIKTRCLNHLATPHLFVLQCITSATDMFSLAVCR